MQIWLKWLDSWSNDDDDERRRKRKRYKMILILLNVFEVIYFIVDEDGHDAINW